MTGDYQHERCLDETGTSHFEPEVDAPFFDELLDDFAELDVLEQIKRFRWYYDNRPLANIRNARGAIRAWIRRARR